MNDTLKPKPEGTRGTFGEGNVPIRATIRTLRLALCAVLFAGLTANALTQTTTLVSRASGVNGVQGNGDSPYVGAKISGNGQFVVFRSAANNLVANDTNGFTDVFVRDTVTNITTRVSVDSFGGQAIGGNSNNPCISYDGRFVAFSSSATNLVPGGTSGSHVFLHDRLTGQTTLVSVSMDGFTPGNGASDSSAIWSNGSSVKVAFRSYATDLSANDTNAFTDVFIRDMAAGMTSVVSVSTTGFSGNEHSGFIASSISGDGNVVGFVSSASDLVASDANGNVFDVFTRNLSTGVTILVSKTTTGLQGFNGSGTPALSYDGNIVAFQSDNAFVNGDSNNVSDVFVKNLSANTMSRVSIATGANGAQGNGASGKSNGWGIAISSNGSRVVFQSLASNLTKKDTNGFEDIFIRDRNTNTTTMVSVTPSGGPANGSSGGLGTCGVSISANGLAVMFASYASNLVAGDGNGFMDVFVRR